MNFKDILSANAQKQGHETIQLETKKVDKSADKNSFAANLKAAKAKVEVKEIKPDPMEIITTTELGAVPKWSFSALKNYEECPHRLERQRIMRDPQERGDAAKRGEEVHDALEKWIKGEREDLPTDRKLKLESFEGRLYSLRDAFNDGIATTEQKWYIGRDWSPVDKAEQWGVMILDYFIRDSETSCVIGDFKTGRKFGNEMKHSDQGLAYALCAYHRFPEIDSFKIEFLYLDEGAKMERNLSRRQLEVLLPRYHNRALAMTTAKTFPAKSNANSCRFCAYGNNKNKQGKPYGTGTCPSDYYKGND